MRIVISDITPSNNVVMRMHFMERSRQRDIWSWLVRAAIKNDIETINRCQIHVERHAPRMLDYDNMAGGLKFLMDGLVHCRVIDDDSPKVVESLTLRQCKVKKTLQRMIVDIKPLDPL